MHLFTNLATGWVFVCLAVSVLAACTYGAAVLARVALRLLGFHRMFLAFAVWKVRKIGKEPTAHKKLLNARSTLVNIIDITNRVHGSMKNVMTSSRLMAIRQLAEGELGEDIS
jgi:hypothetical protein